MSAAWQAVLAEHRRMLEKVRGKNAMARMKRIYDRAEQATADRLARLVGSGAAPFTHATNSVFMAQIRHGQAVMADAMSRGLADASGAARHEAALAAANGVRRMEQATRGMMPVLPLDDASRLVGLVDRKKTSLLAMHQRSMAAYGARLVRQTEEDLAVSLISGESVDDAITRVRERTHREVWQAERIVRTELSWAANSGHADANKELAKAVPDLWQQWVEHVSDDGQPLDDRVGEDSLALHGQVVRPGGLFVMPPDPRVWTGMWNQRWAHPPNRPNDRSVVVPWSPAWGPPGWRWAGGSRVPVTG